MHCPLPYADQPHPNRAHTATLAALLLLYIGMAIAYSIVAPPFESPDEVGHFFTIKYIADYARLPVPDRNLSARYLYSQEGTQPPLYYAIGALILRLSGLETEDARDYLRVNPHTTCGSPHLEGNKAFLAHDPAREAFPWKSALLALHILRGYSTALGLCTVLGVYAIARLCFPDRPKCALLTAGATALNPQFLFVAAGVNNDNLLVALCTWTLYLQIRTLRDRDLKPSGAVGLGLCIGLAALTKLGGILLLPLSAATVLYLAKNRHTSWRDRRLWTFLLTRAGLVAGLAVAIGGWWYVRNALLYQDPTLIQHHLAIVSRRDPTPLSLILKEVPSIFYSYWGRFTCDISPGAGYYAFWGSLILLGLVGMGASFHRLSHLQRLALAVLALWFGLVFFGWFRWNLMASGVQGRLLFPATASVSLTIAAGITGLLQRAHELITRAPNRTLAVLIRPLSNGVETLLLLWVALAVWVLLGLIRPTFAPPPRCKAPAQCGVSQPLNSQFLTPGGSVELIGYSLQPPTLEPGQALHVTLYLSAARPLTDTYSMGLWLVSAIPGDTTRLAGLDTWPGNGNYPTTAWQPGEIIRDTYRLRIPNHVPRAQAWLVQLNIYRMGGASWFPFMTDGALAGDRAILGMVRVGASAPPDCPPSARLEPAPLFGGVIALRGAQVKPQEGEARALVTLWWQATDTPAEDYTVFVHLVDHTGRLLATGDGPPMQGGFPTSLWRAGDWVEDTHPIQLPSGAAPPAYRIRVGWYHPASGIRLLREDGSDHVELPYP